MSKQPKIHDDIRKGYADIAKTGVWLGNQFNDLSVKEDEDECSSAGGCCGGLTLSANELAEKIAYSKEEVENLPEGANMGLSCGNPTAIAAPRSSRFLPVPCNNPCRISVAA